MELDTNLSGTALDRFLLRLIFVITILEDELPHFALSLILMVAVTLASSMDVFTTKLLLCCFLRHPSCGLLARLDLKF